jgi:hypothetical protein
MLIHIGKPPNTPDNILASASVLDYFSVYPKFPSPKYLLPLR